MPKTPITLLPSFTVLGIIFFAATVTYAQSSVAANSKKAVTAAAAAPTSQAEKKAQSHTEAPTEKTKSGGPHEGIKVHGHWTIDVRNPDGKLVTHREFENSLAFDGPLNLATALGHAATVGFWRIEVDFAAYPNGPCVFNNASIYCLIHENGDTNVPGSGSNDFYTLTVSAPFRPDPNAGKLTLAGNFTVQNPGPIAGVATALGACAPNVAPANCTLGPAFNSYQVLGFSAFSAANNLTPITVSVGQLVQVTVVFSFS